MYLSILLFIICYLTNFKFVETGATRQRNQSTTEIAMDNDTWKGRHLLHADHSGGLPDSSGDGDCPGCNLRRHTEEEIRMYHIELIKMKILKRLNLSAPPVMNTTRRGPIPAPIMALIADPDQMQSDDPHAHNTMADGDDALEEPSGIMKKVAIFAKESHHQDGPGPMKFEFRLEKRLHSYHVQSATLWLHSLEDTQNTEPRPIMYVSEAQGKHQWTQEVTNVQGHIIAKSFLNNEDWTDFDVSHTVKKWFKHGHRSRELTISCINCDTTIEDSFRRDGTIPVHNTGDLRPFLVINMEKKKKRRTRRNAYSPSCNSEERCCKEALYIDFEEIGWSDWILAPPRYNAGYCHGACHSPHFLGTYPRSLTETMDQPEHSQARYDIAPCCAAVRMRSMSVLYVHPEGTDYVTEEMPDMRVVQCKCR